MRAILLVVVGLGLRTGHFASDRPLGFDESSLALNIVERDWNELLGPLDHHQGGPWGYLLALKAAVSVFGPTEHGFRVIAFISGVLGMVLMALISRALLGAYGSLVAIGWFSLNPYLIYYSGEAKQYSSDVLASVVAILALRNFGNPARSLLQSMVHGVVGIVLVLSSFPSVFIIAAIGVSGLVRALRRRDLKTAGVGALSVGIWAGCFLGVYIIVGRSLLSDTYLEHFWESSFMPFPPVCWSDLKWPLKAIHGLAENPAGLAISGTSLVMADLGIVLASTGWWTTRHTKESWIVLLVVLFTGTASAMRAYPFQGRLLLFLLPLLILVGSAGCDAIRQFMKPAPRRVGILLIAVVLVPQAVASVEQFVRAEPPSDVRQGLLFISAHQRPGDAVYVYHGAVPGFSFYRRLLTVEDARIVLGVRAPRDEQAYDRDLSRFAGRERVWILMAHITPGDDIVLRNALDRAGSLQEASNNPKAPVYLYRFR